MKSFKINLGLSGDIDYARQAARGHFFPFFPSPLPVPVYLLVVLEKKTLRLRGLFSHNKMAYLMSVTRESTTPSERYPGRSACTFTANKRFLSG